MDAVTEKVEWDIDAAMQRCEHVDPEAETFELPEWGRIVEGGCPVCPAALEWAGRCPCCGWSFLLTDGSLTISLPLRDADLL